MTETTKRPTFATYLEREADVYSCTITQALLASQIKGAIGIAQVSAHWSKDMQTGAQALADHLIATFKLQNHMP